MGKMVSTWSSLPNYVQHFATKRAFFSTLQGKSDPVARKMFIGTHKLLTLAIFLCTLKRYKLPSRGH